MMKTVLLVDDNVDNRLIYKSMLVHRGYRVIEAADGDSGVAMARTEHPDLVLMDMGLPGQLDGWGATAVLKADGATQAIPIIALTAHAMGDDKARALEIGCAAFLPKPVEPKKVADEVARVLGA